MAAPGDAVAMAPAQRVEHRTSLRRSLMLKVTKSALSKPDSMSESESNMGFIKHERTLSEKAKALQERKRRQQEMLAGRSIPVGLPVPVGRRTPRHVDLLEFALQRARDYNDEKVRAQVGVSSDSMGTSISYMADPPPPRDPSTRHIAYQKHLEESYGLSMNEKRPKPAAVHRLGPQDAPFSRPESDMSTMTADSMAVNFHMVPDDKISAPSSKAPKPKLQVTVPDKQTAAPTSKHLIHQFNRAKTHRSKQPDVSPPSSTTQQKPRGEAPARLSIVSPLSVVEMPKPRRPFSAFSLEDMTSEIKAPPKSAPLHKSTSSDSEDTGQDDAESNYSRPSSKSSLSDPPTILQDLEDRPHSTFSVMNPTAAGVFDNMPAVPRIPKQHLKHAKSTASIRLNTNKPLPPEPGLEEVQPLRLPNQAYSRNSIHGKRKAPAPLAISRSSTIDINGRLPNRVSSLRSKYTPADLDALDAAFVDQSPQTHYRHQKHPSLEQAQLELEAQLNTIDENDFESLGSVTFAHDPLQVSRGPNHMVPSRDAPQPPNLTTNSDFSDGPKSNRKRLSKKPSIHVALQMKTQEHDGGELRKRISAPYGLSQKANRILGELTAIGFAAPMKREASKESNWSSSESPDTSYDDSSSSPDMSGREQSGTPETDASSLPDPAFEEVKARLELLSPQNDAASYWSNGRTSYANNHKLRTETSSMTLPSHVSQYDIPIQLDDQVEPGDIQARRGRDFKDHARSLASIAISEIHDLYAELPPPLPSPFPMTRDEMSAEEVDRMISADAAEKVLLLILQNLENLSDLFATATVSRGFYRTFKRHELPLMKSALKGMSPAAWELREMSSPYPGLESEDDTSPRLEYTPALYLQHYMRDMYTMIALKSMILIHCESFLRPDTITALAGGETARASQIDDAFWRVWTFCQIFGCGSNREDDIVSQMDWLRGGVQARNQTKARDGAIIKFNPPSSFGRGNLGGLTAEDLYDMTEIWTCLGVLVRGFQGKRQEARDFGVFDKADIAVGDVEAEDRVLEEWTHYLLALAPPTVLDITSPNSPNASNFAHARAKGYTNWTPPLVSRATFLKEAISRVYQEKVAEERTSAPTSPKANINAIAKNTIGNTNPEESPVNDTVAARWRVQRHAAEIRARKMDPNFKAIPPSEDRPMSEWTSVLTALDANGSSKNAPPLPSLNKSHHRATPSECDTAKHMVSALVVPAGPQVKDPVDLAVEKLVGLGFEAAKAKKALADTDTGNSINFDDALEYLVRERKRDVSGLMHEGYRGKAEERGLRSQQQQQDQIEHERLMQQGLEGLVSPIYGGGASIGLGIGGMDRKFG